jgi:transposase
MGARPVRTSAPQPSRATASTRTRTTMSESEREAAAFEFIQSSPDGVTAKAVSEHIGVSPQTGTKVVNALLESGRIRSEGERRARRLLAA